MTATGIPVLQTGRLVLRGFAEDDLDDYARISGDERVYRWLGGKGLTRDEAWRSMATHLGHWAIRGYGQWALEDRESGSFVGRAGLWQPEGWPGLEIGWTIDPAWWRRGYASEAGRAALTWAFDDLGADEVISITLPDNAASRGVMDKLGLSFDRSQQLLGFEQVVYRIDRATWARRG